MPAESKVCPKCRTLKPANNFNVLKIISPQGIRRYKSHCRTCENSRNHERQAAIRARNRQWLNEYKKNHPCEICGENEPVCLDFHHLKSKPGIINKASFWAQKTFSIEELNRKISECALLCSNCHRKIHVAVEILCKIAGIRTKTTAYIKNAS